MDKNTCCPICVKEFFKTGNLRRHIKRFHPESFKPLPKKQFAFTCNVCGKNFSYSRNFKCHQKIHDPSLSSSKSMKNCPLCMFISKKRELYTHFENNHDIKLVTELINFSSFEHFMTWKLALENESSANFIRAYVQQTKYYDEVILFVCHRSGHHLPRAKNVRKLKTDAYTTKIGGFCPASIKMMKRDDQNIKVFFLKTHVGHSDELTNLKKEPNIKSKIIRLRHKSSSNLPTHLIINNGEGWHFHSQEKKEIFTLARNKLICEGKCPLTCEECKACIHSFSCTCRDWSIKWNMCIHIHLLCRLLNRDHNSEQQLQQQIQQPQDSDTNLDIADLIIYDGVQNEQPTTILQEVQVPTAVSIEDKNLILSEFSELIIKCNSQSLFDEISTTVQQLKMRVDCQEILRPNVENSFSDL